MVPENLYNLFRSNGYPTYYGPRKTPVTADVLEIGLIFAIAILAFSFIIIIPGVRGRERLYYTIRVLVGLFVLGCIILVNFGQEWEVSEIHDVPTQYRAGLKEEIHADITVKIGLRSINITLRAGSDDHVVSFEEGKINETINYNERFHWDSLGWLQGRAGFGPFAGLFNREFRAAQFKGLPYPILWVAEYFTIDGEYIRWGRFYRQAGFYAHVMIWTAFPLWILALIMFKMVLRYGGYFSILTGLSLICANLIYAFVRNPLQLQIPFSEEKMLIFHWGWCFWLCLVLGIATFIIGVVILILNEIMSDKLAKFFDFDITQELEEFYADPAQLQEILAKERGKSRFGFTMKQKKSRDKYTASGGEASNGEATLEMDQMGGYKNPAASNERRQFRKRTMMKSIMADKGKRQRPQPAPRGPAREDSDDDRPDYVNVDEEVKGAGSGGPRGHANVSFSDDRM